jgi:hypothetical protein
MLEKENIKLKVGTYLCALKQTEHIRVTTEKGTSMLVHSYNRCNKNQNKEEEQIPTYTYVHKGWEKREREKKMASANTPK